jgi:hypothetical protein
MWKTKIGSLVILLLALAPGFLYAQTANMAQRMATCTASCHGSSLIAQQRLDRNGWSREIEKMIGWGAQLPDAEKDPFISYLAASFNSSRPRPDSGKIVPKGKGSDVFQTSCLNCHDDKPVAAVKRDRTAWTREVEKMTNWGAYVPAARKDELIDYLTNAFNQ